MRWALPAATGRTRCDSLAAQRSASVIRWLIVIFLALLIFSGLHRWLEKIGLGKLPGDFRFRLFGREFFVPLTSSVLLSFVALLIGQLF
jgi:hypothetical protein